MSDPGVVEHRPSRLARYAPGLAQLRRYDRSWLRADLVAGLVLAAILVPQGMAYAQLAGLPAVTGLYTTMACLVGYAVFGPSRLLVLGPDSSVSPLIFAAIVPILGASKDPADAIALAGRAGAARRGHRDRSRGGEARLRRRPPVEGGPGRLHERPGHRHRRRAAAQAVWLLDRRGHLRHRGHELRAEPRPDEPGHPGRRARHAGRPARAAPGLAEAAGDPHRDRRRDHRLRRPRPLRARGQDGGRAAAGAAQAEPSLDPGQ